MRIAVDARGLMDQPTGIGRYTAQLVRALLRMPDHEVVLYAFGGRSPGEELAALARQPRVELVAHPAPMRVVRRSWRALGAPRLELLVGDVDLVLAAETTMPVTRAPVVAVLHDVLFLEHPAWFNDYVRRAAPQNLDDAGRARALIATCSSTAAAIARARPAYAPRLYVVPPVAPAASPRAPGEDGTVLFVGTLEPRKGLGVLARALLQSTGAAAQLRLVVAGRVGWGDLPGKEALDVLHDEGRLAVLGFVDDERLAALRARATVCAVPSLDEGFGLPLLEALAAGAPTIASDVGALREVAGAAARLVTAGDARAWTAALDELASSPDARARLSGAAAARACAWSAPAQDEALARVLAAAAP